MRTHIFLILLALGISACASKEHVSDAQLENQQEKQEEFTRNHIDAGSRYR